MNNIIDFSIFPSTRYYGSKLRILPWLHSVFKELPFDSVFDRFGGTASVSLLFQQMGKHVTYQDALISNSISAEAILTTKPIDSDSVVSFFDNVKPFNGVISKNFEDIYYSSEENQWLDGAIININKVQDRHFESLCWYSLFQACLKKRPFNMFHRANFNLRTADVTRKFGNLTTWNKSFNSHIYKAISEISNLSAQKIGLKSANILPSGEYKECSNSDLIYLDPPYLKKSKIEDYHKRYHFLEGMTQYKNWPRLINDELKTKLIPTPTYLANWHSKQTFKELLFEEIEMYSTKIVALSYQANGYPSIDTIYNFFVSKFSSVHVYKKPLSHALSKGNKIELLIIGLPK